MWQAGICILHTTRSNRGETAVTSATVQARSRRRCDSEIFPQVIRGVGSASRDASSPGSPIMLRLISHHFRASRVVLILPRCRVVSLLSYCPLCSGLLLLLRSVGLMGHIRAYPNHEVASARSCREWESLYSHNRWRLGLLR